MIHNSSIDTTAIRYRICRGIGPSILGCRYVPRRHLIHDGAWHATAVRDRIRRGRTAINSGSDVAWGHLIHNGAIDTATIWHRIRRGIGPGVLGRRCVPRRHLIHDSTWHTPTIRDRIRCGGAAVYGGRYVAGGYAIYNGTRYTATIQYGGGGGTGPNVLSSCYVTPGRDLIDHGSRNTPTVRYRIGCSCRSSILRRSYVAGRQLVDHGSRNAATIRYCIGRGRPGIYRRSHVVGRHLVDHGPRNTPTVRYRVG